MRKLSVRFTRSPGDEFQVGTIAEDGHRVYFEYDREFLAKGLEPSPFHLPTRPGLFEHTDREFGPLPGLVADSLPDGWGLLLMDRHFHNLGLDVAAVSPLERLAWLGSRTMGALTYHPPADREGIESSVLDLHELGSESRKVLEGKTAHVLPALLAAGGSPAGARPKVLVGVSTTGDELVSGEDDLPADFEHWIVKFAAREDSQDIGAVEFAYSRMARAAGVRMPETRIFHTDEGDRFFGVKRFDRDGNRRFHLHTLGGLLHADHRVPCCDYKTLLKATSALTHNQQDVVVAFRLMVFNVLAHNRDDHVKNFAFILDDTTGEWTLSPAYDVTYAAGPRGEHWMTVSGEARAPRRDHILRLADAADIPRPDAESIIEKVAETVAHWPHFANESNVTPTSTHQIATRLADCRIH